MDESTDVYRLEQCISFIRFSIRGEIYTRFLDVISVVRPNAEQITECIFKMMERNLNWIPPKEENILSDDQFTQHLQGNFESDDEDEEITRKTRAMKPQIMKYMILLKKKKKITKKYAMRSRIIRLQKLVSLYHLYLLVSLLMGQTY